MSEQHIQDPSNSIPLWDQHTSASLEHQIMTTSASSGVTMRQHPPSPSSSSSSAASDETTTERVIALEHYNFFFEQLTQQQQKLTQQQQQLAYTLQDQVRTSPSGGVSPSVAMPTTQYFGSMTPDLSMMPLMPNRVMHM